MRQRIAGSSSRRGLRWSSRRFEVGVLALLVERCVMAADLEHDLRGDDLADLPQFLQLDAGVNRVQQLADEVEVGRGTDKHFLRPTGDGMHNEVLVGLFTEAREIAAVEVLDVAAILVEMVGRWHTASIDLLNWSGPRFCFRRER